MARYVSVLVFAVAAAAITVLGTWSALAEVSEQERYLLRARYDGCIAQCYTTARGHCLAIKSATLCGFERNSCRGKCQQRYRNALSRPAGGWPAVTTPKSQPCLPNNCVGAKNPRYDKLLSR